MAYTKPFPAATAGRGALVLLVVCLLAVTAFANGPVGAAAAPVATSLPRASARASKAANSCLS